ncbi:hypothetical protein FM037_01360 [Shewanella psychropiezotolerans]|uniref:Uncharacterized protein n=1 Tax=Shewanella psychropiezotolerans TaxID=2593655 RepID=A0ABX5WSQ5_9GAMM|nr:MULTISPECIES: hypothetical protein [Shewanella]MPY26764.1 hypothetical protein [Shewanella sp. YLB-07]QDO82122.1 hypothetical protein FM037_01360 [Shewanella psychropiezotolerans]
MAISNAGTSKLKMELPLSDADVDWCHIQETTKVLLLAMAQIELSLSDGEHNVTSLGALFTDMAMHLEGMNSYLTQVEGTPFEVLSHGENLATAVNEGVVAFQFYDRVSQRLQHVIMGLALMEEVLSSQKQRISPESWKKLQEEIEGSYSLDCERKMFNLVLQGVPVHEALKLYKDQHQVTLKDDIELF